MAQNGYHIKITRPAIARFDLSQLKIPGLTCTDRSAANVEAVLRFERSRAEICR